MEPVGGASEMEEEEEVEVEAVEAEASELRLVLEDTQVIFLLT
jgi:hypothetical protein